MSFEDFKNSMIDEIPEECSITYDHAIEHVRSARDAQRYGDNEQAAHGFAMAARIFFALCWTLDGVDIGRKLEGSEA